MLVMVSSGQITVHYHKPLLSPFLSFLTGG